MEKEKRLNVNLDKKAHGELKAYAAMSGITISMLVRRLIIKFLSEISKYQ